MKIPIIFALTIIAVFFIQINGIVYDRRYDYRRQTIDDTMLDSPLKRNYLTNYKYRDLFSNEDFGNRNNNYDRIRIDKLRRYPYERYLHDRNDVKGRFYDRNNYLIEKNYDSRRRNFEYDARKYTEQQNPNQFWENGKKYEIINGKTFEVFDVGTH